MTRLALFLPDVAEASQIRLVNALRDAGAEVESVSFRRDNMNAGFAPDWPDVRLGRTRNGLGPRRAADMARALPRLADAAAAAGRADALIARGADMALVALAARRLAGVRTPLVYLCPDIHGAMTEGGATGALARRAERLVLRGTARLVVTSPAFLREYFGPVQRWRGPSGVLENRLPRAAGLPDRDAAPPPARGPLTLGWVGTLRCRDSLALLAGAARALGPDRLRIVLRGVVHPHLADPLRAVLAAKPGAVCFEGPYGCPDGLADGYGGLDLVWAQDLWQRGANSDWLLPNRLYEAGHLGIPLIAVEGTETARRIGREGSGIVLPDACPKMLATRLSRLTRGDLGTIRARILSRGATGFVAEPGDVLAALLPPRPGAVPVLEPAHA